MKKIRDQILGQQLRLELRRTELQKMFTAADLAMSRISSQQGALGAIGFGVLARMFHQSGDQGDLGSKNRIREDLGSNWACVA